MQIEEYKNGFKKPSTITNEKARKYLFYIFVFFIIYVLGFIYFALTLEYKNPFPNEKTDAIITLTGETKRIIEGIEELNKGNSEKYFISGVHLQGPIEKVIENTIKKLQKNKELKTSYQILRSKIETGKAENTIENALESAVWINKNKIKSIRLMTSFYHMPRSKLVFQKYMPNDLIIIYHPVLFTNNNPNPFTDLKLFKIVFSEYNKFLVTYVWNLTNLETSTTLKLQGVL